MTSNIQSDETTAKVDELIKHIKDNLTSLSPACFVFRPCDIPEGMSVEEFISTRFKWEKL